MNLAIFLPNWVGDAVMATPALRAIRRHFAPSARIVGIHRPHLAELLSGTDWIDEPWCFDPASGRAEWGRMALVSRLRRERFEMAVLLTNSLHTALLAWLGGVKERVGYARDLRGPLLTRKLYPARNGRRWLPTPVVQTYLSLAEAAGCAPESPRLELAVTPAERRLGEQIWHDMNLRPGRVIALNSSGAYGSAKVWPAAHCGALARHIVRELDYDVLVLCGPRERDQARDIVEYAACSRVFSLAGHSPSLSMTKACLQRSQLLVSTDSGPRHIAAALGRPVVTLMGPTLPAWIENPTVRDRTVRLDLDCLGCGKRSCPRRHHRCMRGLLHEHVLGAVKDMVEERHARAA
jgi:heptosyltransferase II